ncbi:hypothetical protein ACWIVU_11050, partial [Ursidibacter arcticus]
MNIYLIIFSVLFNQLLVFISRKCSLSIKSSLFFYFILNMIYASTYEFFVRGKEVDIEQSIFNIFLISTVFAFLNLILSLFDKR